MFKLFRAMRFFIPFLVFVLLVIFFWVGLGKDPTQIPSELINKPMPSFSLPSLQDRELTLSRELFMGHISVLHVWASWCHSCQREHPLWVDIAKDNPKIGFYGLAYKDAHLSASDWLQQHGNPYQFCIDDEAGALAMDLGVSATPETFLVDANGIIRFKFTGAMSKGVWQREFVPRIASLEHAG
ncbi:MAG: DsbE family thiol:disulfide interchange protein [Pseudomonadota bacterium]|nr:DsbE family thiol:disulfide interchange protein [Pseudomonadota bacterium]